VWGWAGQGREWTCLGDGELTQLKQAAEAAGAQIVEERIPSLEEVFLARTRSESGRREP
jgi:ABC-2 type transport system ATP-binding protein